MIVMILQGIVVVWSLWQNAYEQMAHNTNHYRLCQIQYGGIHRTKQSSLFVSMFSFSYWNMQLFNHTVTLQGHNLTFVVECPEAL